MSASNVIVFTHLISVEVSVALEIDDSGNYKVLDVAAETADDSEVSLKLATVDIGAEREYFEAAVTDFLGK